MARPTRTPKAQELMDLAYFESQLKGPHPELRRAIKDTRYHLTEHIHQEQNKSLFGPPSEYMLNKSRRRLEGLRPDIFEKRLVKRNELDNLLAAAKEQAKDPEKKLTLDKRQIEGWLNHRNAINEYEKDPTNPAILKKLAKIEKNEALNAERQSLNLDSTAAEIGKISNLTPSQETGAEQIGKESYPALAEMIKKSREQANQSPLKNVLGNDLSELLQGVAPAYLSGILEPPSQFGLQKRYNPTGAALLGTLLGQGASKLYDRYAQANPLKQKLQQGLQGQPQENAQPQPEQQPYSYDRNNRVSDMLARLQSFIGR